MRSNWQGEFQFDQLRSTPDRGRVRNQTVDSTISWTLLLIILLSFSAFGLAPSLLEPIADNWARILLFAVPAVMLVAIVALFLAPRIDYATFRFSGGQPAFTISKAGPNRNVFEGFVTALSSEIARKNEDK